MVRAEGSVEEIIYKLTFEFSGTREVPHEDRSTISGTENRNCFPQVRVEEKDKPIADYRGQRYQGPTKSHFFSPLHSKLYTDLLKS